MKKLLFVSLIAVGLSANAQKISVGLKAGANITNFSKSPIEEVTKDALVGFYGGAYLNFSLANTFFIQPEALISTQGAKFKSDGVTENIKLTYVTVPVMFKYKSMGGFYLEAGPQVGFKISESIPGETISNFAKNLDLSLAAGLGFQTGSGFGVGARYAAGLSKVGDFDASEGVNPDFKNSAIQVGIFYTFK